MNVLETRYTSPEMRQIWEEKTRITVARGIWVVVMLNQNVEDEIVNAYKAVMEDIDVDAHREREKLTGHETKAWIDIFNEQAGHQAIHHGMTSCDITENVTTWQIRMGMVHIGSLAINFGVRAGAIAEMYRDTPMVGRTHGLPAQVTTLGKRFANCLQEVAMGMNSLSHHIGYMPIRGIKGAVGTMADIMKVLDGLEPGTTTQQQELHVRHMESHLAETLEARSIMACVGQTPPRGMDAEIAQTLVSLGAGPVSLATSIRLMVQLGLVTERPPKDHTGSSAMPHKSNPRYAERVCGLQTVVRGFANMLSETVGGIWHDGDVSDSAIRRIALPGLFMATEGLFRSAIVMLDRFEPDLQMIEDELERHAYELHSAEILATCVSRGVPREDAHAAIRDWFRGDREALVSMLGFSQIEEFDGPGFDIGAAASQVDAIMLWVRSQAAMHPKAAQYEPEDSL